MTADLPCRNVLGKLCSFPTYCHKNGCLELPKEDDKNKHAR